MVEQREKEILQIVRSIQDLNEIFKDLATLVVDQVWHFLKMFLRLFSLYKASYNFVSFSLLCYVVKLFVSAPSDFCFWCCVKLCLIIVG